jgi:hypothetical protein
LRKKSANRNIRKDFAYEFSREKLEEFRFMSAEARLEWLEEAQRFVYKFLDKEKRGLWDERLG